MNKQLVHRKNHSLQSWFRDMNSMFDKFNRGVDLNNVLGESEFPNLEVKETENGYNVKAEVPGMEEKDLSLSLRDNNLIIEGERKSEKKEEDKSHFFSEFKYGSFYRAIPLSDEVDENNINATYKNGILQIELKKLPTSSQKQKRITIKH